MNRIPFDQPLRASKSQISLLSYNILLPNNTEGWWIPKCYTPHTPAIHRTWVHRKQLIHDILLGSASDILCLQEVAQSSWEEDFKDVFDKGYTGILHKKNNLFRCATLFRTSKFSELETKHAFRTLVHLFTWSEGIFAVINVHLSGGPHPKTRMAQLHEALNTLRKMCAKNNIHTDRLPIFIAGDFNCNPLSNPISRFLSTGLLTQEDRDPTYPNTQLTKKGKRHPFSNFEHPYQKVDKNIPSTLFAPPLIDHFCVPHQPNEIMNARAENKLRPFIKRETIDLIQKIFYRYTNSEVMNEEACLQWILTINGAKRGGEWKELQRLGGTLSRLEFTNIYIQNLNNGLWWSLASDLEKHQLSLPISNAPLHEEALDHIFIRRMICKGIRILPTNITHGLPNSTHPSDHLPIGVIASPS